VRSKNRTARRGLQKLRSISCREYNAFSHICARRDWDSIPNHERLTVFNGVERPQQN